MTGPYAGYDLVVRGQDGENAPNPVTPGENGVPFVDGSGNGTDGESEFFGWSCKVQATPGKPGDRGKGAPSAANGSNGLGVMAVTITCNCLQGGSLSLLVKGGDGGNGGGGGAGGNGADGGNAGKQPKACKDFVPGGAGGNSGKGGDAGCGGDGGNSADVTLLYGSQLSSLPVSVTNIGGKAGVTGTPGNPGNPGKGGLNSDNTPASDGGRAGGGSLPSRTPQGGYGGSFTGKQVGTQPPAGLTISIVPPTSP